MSVKTETEQQQKKNTHTQTHERKKKREKNRQQQQQQQHTNELLLMRAIKLHVCYSVKKNKSLVAARFAVLLTVFVVFDFIAIISVHSHFVAALDRQQKHQQRQWQQQQEQ